MRILLLCLSSLILLGCMGTPEIPSTDIQQGARIGVYIDVPEELHHQHIGTTAFNNEEKTLPYDWDYQNQLEQVVVTKLKNAGFETVIIPKGSIEGFPKKEPLITYSDKEWRITPEQQPAADYVKNTLELDALFVMQSSENLLVSIECGMSDCSYRKMSHPGLYSRSMFGIGFATASFGFDWHIYTLNPYADLTQGKPLSNTFRMASTGLSSIEGYEEPEDWDNVTESEALIVRQHLLEDVQSRTERVIKFLRNEELD